MGQIQPPKDSRKSWIIGCSIAAGAVIVLCTLMSLALFRAVYDPIEREVDAKAMMRTFCREMESQARSMYASTTTARLRRSRASARWISF